jgi:hypothetical protein
LIRFIRVGQIIFLIPFVSVGRMAGEPLLHYLSALCVLVIVEVGFSPIVFATLSEDGLQYQRWTKMTRVTWSEIKYGGVAPVGFLLVRLIGKPIWSRYLLLKAPDPPLRDDQANLPGATRFCEVMEPPSGRTN